jgi:hypothetical protein
MTMDTRTKADNLMIMSHSPIEKVQWPHTMDSRSTNGLQYTHVSMKSAHEAQVEAPQLTAPMSALFPLHER